MNIFLCKPYISLLYARWKKYVFDNFRAFFIIFNHANTCASVRLLVKIHNICDYLHDGNKQCWAMLIHPYFCSFDIERWKIKAYLSNIGELESVLRFVDEGGLVTLNEGNTNLLFTQIILLYFSGRNEKGHQ